LKARDQLNIISYKGNSSFFVSKQANDKYLKITTTSQSAHTLKQKCDRSTRTVRTMYVVGQNYVGGLRVQNEYRKM